MITLQEYIQYVSKQVIKEFWQFLAIGCIVGVDIPLGKQVKDAGLDMDAALVFPPCRQDRVS